MTCLLARAGGCSSATTRTSPSNNSRPPAAPTIASSPSRTSTPADRRRSTRRRAPNRQCRDTSTPRLRALRERIDTLDAQRAALPRSELHEFDSVHARAIALTQQRAELTAALKRLSSPTRSLLGRVRDPDLVERVRLTSALGGIDQAIDRTREAETALRERLGDPEQIRAELDGLDRAITQLEHERNGILDRAHRPRTPSPGRMGARAARRPARRFARPRLGRRAARASRATASTTPSPTPTEPLGPQPVGRAPRPASGSARRGAVERVERGLDREHTHDHDLGHRALRWPTPSC